MFIGTKKQAQDPVRSYAEKCGMPYVNERWLGGMLTNFETISKRVAKMQEYERMRLSGDFEAMPKKEALLLSRELEKLQRNLGGIRNMTKRPDAVFILDTKKEHIAVTEANKLGIPVVAVVDTNCRSRPRPVRDPGQRRRHPRHGLMCRVIADAIEEGRFVSSKRNPQAAPRTEADRRGRGRVRRRAGRRPSSGRGRPGRARGSPQRQQGRRGDRAGQEAAVEPRLRCRAEAAGRRDRRPRTATDDRAAATETATDTDTEES